MGEPAIKRAAPISSFADESTLHESLVLQEEGELEALRAAVADLQAEKDRLLATDGRNGDAGDYQNRVLALESALAAMSATHEVGI